MKTLLYTSIYLDGDDAIGNSRLKRTQAWLEYCWSIQEELGFDSIVMCDNGSSMENLLKLGVECQADSQEWRLPLPGKAIIHSYRDHIPTGTGLSYPYCWRALYHQSILARIGVYDKIIAIDNDAYILSKRMANYMRDLPSGWMAPWCPRWSFPECAISVICKEYFPTLEMFCVDDYTHHDGKLMEKEIPYSGIMDFKGDRYGEFKLQLQQNGAMDFYCQKPLTIPVSFNKGRMKEDMKNYLLDYPLIREWLGLEAYQIFGDVHVSADALEEVLEKALKTKSYPDDQKWFTEDNLSLITSPISEGLIVGIRPVKKEETAEDLLREVIECGDFDEDLSYSDYVNARKKASAFLDRRKK